MPTLEALLAARRAAVRPPEAASVRSGPVDDLVSVRFELPREMSVATVPGIREALLAWVDQRPAGQAWCLSAAAVEEVDAAGLQLLLSLASRAAARYVRLRLLEPSIALRSACAALGLAEVLLEPETSSSEA